MAKPDGSYYGDGKDPRDSAIREVSSMFPKSMGFPESYRLIEECLGWLFFSEPKEVVIEEYVQELIKHMSDEEIKEWHEECVNLEVATHMKEQGYTYLDGLTTPYVVGDVEDEYTKNIISV